MTPTEETHWVAARIEEVAGSLRLVDEAADVPVYGTSPAFLLDAALDSGGDIAHLECGRLDRLDEPPPHRQRPAGPWRVVGVRPVAGG